MDCFYHNAVPSLAACRRCGKPICGTCRDAGGDCPGCVLAARVEAARRATMIDGGIGPSTSPHARPEAGPPSVPRAAAVACRPETRALVALSYPFWPLALLALLDARGSHFARRQAWQALGFNLGLFGFSTFLGAAATVPLLGLSVWPLLAFIFPVWAVASVVYAVKVWQGDDVNVPLVSDWVDARLPGESAPQS